MLSSKLALGLWLGVSILAFCLLLPSKNQEDNFFFSKAFAFGLECQDRSRCDTVKCWDDGSPSYRAGNLCEHFPYYNGKMSVWTPVTHMATCTQHGPRFCQAWEIHEESREMRKDSRCECRAAFNETFCEKWTCQSTIDAVCPVESDGKCCEVTKFGRACFNNRFTVPSQCTCVNSSRDNSFCASWTCSQDGSEIALAEHHQFTCVSDEAQGSMCSRWEGSGESSLKFQLASCGCRDEHCLDWECDVRSIRYQFPNLWWSVVCLMFIIPLHIYTTGKHSSPDQQKGPKGRGCGRGCVLSVCYGMLVFVVAGSCLWLGGVVGFILFVSTLALVALCTSCFCSQQGWSRLE